MKKNNLIADYNRIESLPVPARAAMYQDGKFTTAVKLESKKEYSEKMRALIVLHWYRMRAARMVINKLKKGNALQLDEMIFLNKMFDYSISKGTDKMAGIFSISTACFLNKQCAKNARIAGSICEKCYAVRTCLCRFELSMKLELNTLLYSSVIIPADLLPFINSVVFRLESFGDLQNEIQMINYINVCKKNPSCIFAQWTKNPHIIEKALKAGYKKPRNLIIVYSSLFLDNNGGAGIIKKYPFINKVFTVYTVDYLKDHKDIKINCGGRSCINCLNCYKKDGPRVINELLKSDKNAARAAGIIID